MNNVPPQTWRRNEYGLLQHMDYSFASNGLVEWKKMISSDHFVLNKQKKNEIEKEYHKPFEDLDIVDDKIDEKYWLTLLAGYRNLAYIRGFESIQNNVIASTDTYVSVVTTIKYVPNFETNFQSVSFSAVADASIHNTFNFARNFLCAVAENRGFVRCVRNFLNIPIPGFDEVEAFNCNERGEEEKGTTAHYDILSSLMKEKGKGFEDVKQRLISKKVEGADRFESIEEIPVDKVFMLIESLKSLKKPKDKN